jgi:hypothetical protein
VRESKKASEQKKRTTQAGASPLSPPSGEADTPLTVADTTLLDLNVFKIARSTSVRSPFPPLAPPSHSVGFISLLKQR